MPFATLSAYKNATEHILLSTDENFHQSLAKVWVNFDRRLMLGNSWLRVAIIYSDRPVFTGNHYLLATGLRIMIYIVCDIFINNVK